MANKVTLEQAERLTAQLTPQEQIKLIACIIKAERLDRQI